ncbi:ASCH domain-containing protein [Promicromonospora kroppenstedtii]|uniref:ASCH domain-containing protein n=1 Tax=Promicromonospora kroppenstedtii TaxID=440482 RepID=UPI0004BCC3E3|nr:ASCH domain-containing protein [Promicromonospora kroppenstedtii]
MTNDANPQAADDNEQTAAAGAESRDSVEREPAGAEPEEFDPATFDPESVPVEDAELAAEVLDFWGATRQHAGMAKASIVVGHTVSETVPPPAWSFGDEPELAETLLAAVLAGDKTATSSALWDYDDEGAPLPVVGELSILLDGERHPRALIRTTSVVTTTFDEVDDDFAAAEGEDDRTLESWRAGHEAYFRRTLGEGREFSADMPIVCERFELLYPKR